MNIYISYSHRDKKTAELIASSLRDEGHTIWIDFWKLKPGDNLVEKINDGLKEADALIVLISSASMSSDWVRYEFSAMALGDISSEKRRIIPVLLEKVPIPDYLAQYVYVDFTEEQSGLQQILNAVQLTEKEPEEKKMLGWKNDLMILPLTR